MSLLHVLKLCEEQQIKAVFWFGPGETMTGVPKHEGFSIDTGELFSVNGHTVALHDFRSLILTNPDHHSNR